MASQGWTTAIAAWTLYMKASGVPETTRSQREYHVSRLARDLPETAPRSVTLDDLVNWLADHNWAPNTRRSYRSSLRAFFTWALATGRVDNSPAHLLPAVRIPRPKPRPTPELAYRNALGSADERARLAIQLAARCGLRRGEIAKSRREDVSVDLLGRTLRVEGKGGHIRLVPLPDDLATTIEACPEGWLFPSNHGGHLTPHHLGKIVSRLLPGALTTHTLRHRAATVAYSGTRDLRAVQELLGHAKPETTAIYTEIPSESVRAAMMAAAA